ncbi:MAG TPA: MarR family winged helix-turn-helix transcriptional regulator [Segeticoccus sp.]|nr:MarR family winged helix-turn-helix transcriptional regulator [Segeticoccus sp.]
MSRRPRQQRLSRDRRLAALLLQLDRQRHAVAGSATLAAAELRLLWLFSDGRPRTLREIADALRLEQSTVNRQVNGAIQAGHLHRFTEKGRTARLVAPTPAGRERFATDTALVLRLYDEALADLGDEGRPFLDLLDRFVEAYAGAAERATGTTSAAAPAGGNAH